LDFSSRGEITIAREIRVISARSVSHVIDKSDVISALSSAFLARANCRFETLVFASPATNYSPHGARTTADLWIGRTRANYES